MALVAYDDSDNSDISDEEEEGVTTKPSLFGSLPAPKQLETDEIPPETASTSSLFASLPAPKSLNVLDEPEEMSVPVKQTPDMETASKKRPKIVVPSVKFDDDEEDDAPKPKILKPSGSGSGLFSVLPPPKNSINKQANRPLIPHTVKNPPLKPVAKPKPKPIAKPLPRVFLKSTEEETTSDIGSNFFNLDEPDPIPVTLPKAALPILEEQVPYYPSTTIEQPTDNVPYYDYTAMGADEVKHYEYPTTDSAAVPYVNQIPELQKLARKGKEEIVFIDVKQDDHLESKEQWMLKALTEEKPTSSFKKGGGPSAESKRKHQITYLAHQAKEREIELKNEWAQNRATRQQTRSKYGF